MGVVKEQIGKITMINGDCMEVMKDIPDAYYDLAICDPPYGIGANKMTLGNGKTEIYRGETDWDKLPPPTSILLNYKGLAKIKYFGVLTTIFQGYRLTHHVGLCGIKERVTTILQIVNLHGHHSSAQLESFSSHGLVLMPRRRMSRKGYTQHKNLLRYTHT